MPFTMEDMIDLVATTQRELGEGHFNSVAANLTDYPVATKLLRGTGDWVEEHGSGYGWERQIMYKHSGRAKMTKLDAVDNPGVDDVMGKWVFPWRHFTTDWSVERREILANRSPAKIVDLVKVRSADAMTSLYELVEEQAWSAPASSANDEDLQGIPFYVQKNATEGFNGGLPSGWSTIAGIDVTDAKYGDKLKNYTGTYTAISKPDWKRTATSMMRQIQFKNPVAVPEHGKVGHKYVIYINNRTATDLEEMGEAQNDNLGKDLAPYGISAFGRNGMGQLTFRGIELMYVPQLNSDTSDPTYFINHNKLGFVFLKGDRMHMTKIDKNPYKHNWATTYYDNTGNFECTDRRSQGVLYKA